MFPSGNAWLHAFCLRTRPLAANSIIVGSALVTLGACQQRENVEERTLREEVWPPAKRIVPSGVEDTVLINGAIYRLVQDTNNHIHVITSNDTSALCEMEGIVPQLVEVTDFDRDGYDDVIVHFFSNTPGQVEIYLFDTSTMKFVHLEDALGYYAPYPLDGTPYYVSYNRAGCADYRWESHLFGIDRHRAFPMGRLYGRQCPGDEHPAVLAYRALDNERWERIDSLPGDTSGSFFRKKWEFIHQYWKKNHARFIGPPQ